MIQNFFKIAWRSLLKNKGFTALNISGLAIGMAAAMLIFLWVSSEVSFDRFYFKTDRLYAVGTREPLDNEISVFFSTPKPLAPVIKNEFPEVENTTRVSGNNGILFTTDEQKLTTGEGAFVDSSFLEMFGLPLLSGNPNEVLKDPSTIVLSEELAKKLYGTTDVVGKNLSMDRNQSLTVSGVLKLLPSNSRFANYEYLLPWTGMEKLGYADKNWGNSSVLAFVELAEHANLAAVQQKIQKILQRHAPELRSESFLQPLSEKYLYSKFENGKAVGGRIEMVRIFIVIACFILLIACINFMNLSTAQSERRAKEVGVRKVVGAQKRTLVAQFLTESFLLTFISGTFALLLLLLALPSFSDLVGRALHINLVSWEFWSMFGTFILLTGLLAGSYPAFFLSSFRPIKVLKGKFFSTQSKLSARKVLVVCQFVIAIILIVSTLVIRKQIQYGQDRESGYQKDNLVYIPENGDIQKNIHLIKQALIDQNIAASVTRTMSPLTERWSGWNGFEWEGKDPKSSIQFNRQTADDKLVATAGFTLVEGRDFDLSKFPTDSNAAILNESAIKVMGLKNPIGSYIIDGGSTKFHIIGVIKDFIQESPFDPVMPLVFEGANGFGMQTLHIKFNPALNTKEALEKTAKIFKAFNPDYPFEYKFIDDEYATKFAESQKIGQLATLFSGLTIFISCLGLFGLAAFMAENRTKEIGIRKVLGASIFSITKLLSNEFLSLVALACLIAFPIAFWAMYNFLKTYAYRTDIGWDIFLLAGVGALLISAATVSYQSIKAAIANPVDSLRDE
ncbi:ABC transporter permease [Sphingobacterium paludis]|uniref:FtsX-like permease family protein n=1 Tax=Sphingobacterium paludis TaxID=1476465 RepID=A0A4R7D4E5_9SPHI|nr:ABC transporter permease [Sphingobacterium paludis]TDS15953.1 FtsX-like permease family protein [Sphingobacterium paludis]